MSVQDEYSLLYAIFPAFLCALGALEQNPRYPVSGALQAILWVHGLVKDEERAILSGGVEGGRFAQTMSCRVGAATCHCKLWSKVLGARPLRVAPSEQVKLDEARMKNFIKGGEKMAEE